MAPATAGAQSTTITFTTTPTKLAMHAPNNVVAVWVEKQGGGFVRTLADWAAIRQVDLIAFDTATNTNKVDAVTGATFTMNGTRMVVWDMQDANKVKVANGNYVIKMELSDSNVTMASQNNFAQFNLTVGPNPVNTTMSMGGFNNVNINYNPTAALDMGGPPPAQDMSVAADLAMAPASMASGCELVPRASAALPLYALGIGAPLLLFARRRRRAQPLRYRE